jgi:hypothetical protein
VNFRAFDGTKGRPTNIHPIDKIAHGPLSSVVERVTRNDEVGCSIQPAGNHFSSFWMSVSCDPLFCRTVSGPPHIHGLAILVFGGDRSVLECSLLQQVLP